MRDTTLNSYQLTAWLGKGGMGDVYAAVHRVFKDEVAIKFLLEEYAHDPAKRSRFYNEALVARHIKHAGVVKIIDVGECDDDARTPYIIMELIKGGTLAARIQPPGRITLAEACSIGRQIADTMDACHRAGAIHRDLKPENIMLVGQDDSELLRDDRVKILDFGIARIPSTIRMTGSDPDLRVAGRAMGTADYMAPELWTDATTASDRTDVYSLGCITFEMCCGRLPFKVSSIVEARYHHTSVIPPRASEFAAVPRELDDMIARALDKEQSMRPSMRQLLDVFSAFAATDSPLRCQDRSQPEHGLLSQPPHELGRAGAVDESSQDPTTPRAPPWVSAATDAAVPPPSGTDSPVPPVARKSLHWLAIVGVPFACLVTVIYVLIHQQSTTQPAYPTIDITRTGGCPHGMIHIPAATFLMGSPDGVGKDNERPEHRMSLSGYCIDRTEVTVAAYARCVAAGACTPAVKPGEGPSSLCNGNRADRQGYPINCVVWEQAQAYCTFAKKRLLSEAEWEYAARGPGGFTYPWGNEAPSSNRLNACGAGCLALERGLAINEDEAAMYEDDDPWDATAPVDSSRAGASPFGVLNMAGNVWEWTADWYLAYTSDGSPGRAWPNQRGPRRVTRGGAWNTGDASSVRGARRSGKELQDGGYDLGLRCGSAD